jgi:hypothetical protein
MKCLRTAVLAIVAGASALGMPAFAGAARAPFSFQLKGIEYHLAPWDYGTAFRCRAGSHVGVVLMSPHGPAWSFAPYGDLARLQTHRGCGTGAVVSQIAGAGVEDAAHFAVAVRSCAGSCGGYDFFAFRFDGTRGYEELGQALGDGGWKFAFPRLVLYVNKGYHECPSHWLRLSYWWTGGYAPKYMLQKSVRYTSRQCFLAAPKKWPPDPGD